MYLIYAIPKIVEVFACLMPVIFQIRVHLATYAIKLYSYTNYHSNSSQKSVNLPGALILCLSVRR